MTTITYTFDPYSHSAVQTFLKTVKKEFGDDKTRWYWRPRDVVNFDDPNIWVVNFYFCDPKDATLFSLKFL